MAWRANRSGAGPRSSPAEHGASASPAPRRSLQVAGGSRTLVGSGALIVGAGILLHFLLSTLVDDVRGRCTLVITPRDERPYVLVDLSLPQAEAAFDAIRQRHLEANTPRRRAL